MSPMPQDAGAGWGSPQVLPPPAPLAPAGLEGYDPLEVLLAFARILEQAVARRCQHHASPGEIAGDEYFGLDEVLCLVAARAAAITGADGIAIALASEDAIVCRACFGWISLEPGVALDPGSGFSGACLRHGQTVLCDDSETDPRVNPEACRSLGARSMLAVPLIANGRVAGLIEAFSSEPLRFNETHVANLSLLGELVLAAIDPAEEDRLAQLAGRILEGPGEPERPAEERPAEEGWALAEEGASTPAAVEVDPVDPSLESQAAAISDPAAIFDSTTAEAYAPPFLSSTPAGGIRVPTLVPAPFAGPSRPAPETEPAHAAFDSYPKEVHSRSSLALIAGLVLVVLALGWAWVHHAEQLTSASTNGSTPHRRDSREPDSLAAPKAGTAPTVTGLRHWSSAGSSTVVIDVDDPVEYEQQALDNPPRVYFDLPDTKMAPGLLNEGIAVDDAFIKRVRMSETPEGTTRVVLDTKGITEVSVKLDSNPYRLTIDIHKPPASSPASTKPSPAIAGSRRKAPRAAPRRLSEFRVALDAGHGGWDLGTVGSKGLLEKDLVLDIVERLGKLIEERLDAEVIYTRQDDTYLPLEKRAGIANLEQADLFLSVHANYSDLATARGVETYYSTSYSPRRARTVEDNALVQDVNWSRADTRGKVTNAHRLATDVQDALYEGLAARNSAIRNRGVKEAQYVVLTGTQMPAILAEVSFVSSPADEDNLGSSAYRQQIAEALCRGLARYRSQVRPAKLASGEKPPSNSE